MFKYFVPIVIILLTGCSTIDYKDKSVKQITERSAKKIHSWAITEFKVKSTGTYDPVDPNETGIWILSSESSYRSSKSLNIHLATQIVAQIKEKYGFSKIEDFQGRTIRVKGLATPKFYCKIDTCPRASSQNNGHNLYIQTQMFIENLNNITIL